MRVQRNWMIQMTFYKIPEQAGIICFAQNIFYSSKSNNQSGVGNMQKALYQTERECPVCGVTFKTTRVKTSHCFVERRDSDFCVYYKGHNPIFYDVAVCPKCGYSALMKNFSDIAEDDAKNIYQKVGNRWKQRDLGGERSLQDAIEAYKLALYCSQLRKRISHIYTAALCMRLAWLYRYVGDKEGERRFLSHALEQYYLAYEKENLPEYIDEITLIYLIGELNRRLGNYKEAIAWLSKAASHPTRTQKQGIENMAREQWYLARKQAEEEKENAGTYSI